MVAQRQRIGNRRELIAARKISRYYGIRDHTSVLTYHLAMREFLTISLQRTIGPRHPPAAYRHRGDDLGSVGRQRRSVVI